MGAIFMDSPDGMEAVIQVFQHLLSPFVLYVAKFSKILHKEHKEEFIWASIARKIRPKFKCGDEPTLIRLELADD
jgi:hypothetical protein